MNPVFKIINTIIITINKLIDSFDHRTRDLIQNVFYLFILVVSIVAGIFGMKQGQDAAKIKRPPIITKTNDVFDTFVKHNRKGGTFTGMLDKEIIRELKSNNELKSFYKQDENLKQEYKSKLIEPKDKLKRLRHPQNLYDDSILDEIKIKPKNKSDVKRLKKTKILKQYYDLSHIKNRNDKKQSDDLLDSPNKKNYVPDYSKDFPLNIIKYPAKKKNFYLTFDVGDNNEHVSYIINLLNKYRVKGTFFITGNFIKKYPNDVKLIANNGHIIGNHTLNHKKWYTPNSLRYELVKTNDLFKQLTGKNMSKIWRAPYLQHLTNKKLLSAARIVGYQHIDASLVIMDDWLPNAKYALSNDKFLQLFKHGLNVKHNNRLYINKQNYRYYRSGNNNYHGVIMLLHASRYRKGKKDFVYCLEDIILHLKKLGYSFDDCKKFSKI